ALAAAAATSPAAAAAQSRADVAGRSVLITGCSSGFGKLTALHLARGGATVIASMRNVQGGRRPAAQELADVAAKEKLKLSVVEIDVTDDAQVASGVAAAQEIAGGALDVLVNNAGIGISGPVELLDMAATQLIFDTNVFGYLRLARAALPAMRAKKQGLVFNVSSQLGRVVIPGVGHYSSTKFAVEAMFEAMAYELAPFGVEVTIIQPGGYPTKVWENGRRLSDAAIARAESDRRTAYAPHIEMATRMFGGAGGTTDPMDVARAIAEIIAMPAGSRPLRRPVHPDTRATDALNAAHAQVQARALGTGAFAPWFKAVTS
ncbi:MAG: SDR family oxidoreductase, partial [Sphingomonadaceae bacterium]|nr:SDR family oxidoreductase [Sphingomonadaceae bacterium]